eukprot:3468275-Prymnesium_polylepis.1
MATLIGAPERPEESKNTPCVPRLRITPHLRAYQRVGVCDMLILHASARLTLLVEAANANKPMAQHQQRSRDGYRHITAGQGVSKRGAAGSAADVLGAQADDMMTSTHLGRIRGCTARLIGATVAEIEELASWHTRGDDQFAGFECGQHTDRVIGADQQCA